MSKRYTIEEMQEKLDNMFPDEDLTILEWYSMTTPVKIKCNNCGTIFTHTTGRSYFNRPRTCGCAHCSSEQAKHKQEIERAMNERYEILDKTKKRYPSGKITDLYTLRCRNCGHIRYARSGGFLSHPKCGCEEGSRKPYRTAEEFVEEINEKCPSGKYELLSEYVDTKTKVRLRHSCGFIWDVRPNALLKKHAAFCPRCGKVESQGARFVSEVLDALKVPYEREHTLDDSKCRFDFYFILNNQEYVIEYNGKQHYEFVHHWLKTIEEFHELQSRDVYKQCYCIDRDIKMLILPYTLSKQEIIDKICDFIGSTTKLTVSTVKQCSSQEEEDIV